MSRSSWKDYGKKGLGVGKKGFDKAWGAIDKLGAPVNRLSNKVGAEAFWPTTLDKESDKAARILRSFCKDGFYDKVDGSNADRDEQQDASSTTSNSTPVDGPRGKQRVLVKIPSSVIRNAKGLAIFTTMRTGLWFSGAGGSGVLLARNPETGEWSPPSGILLHTAGLGFLVGLDIYDCVVVINTYEALEGFKKVRCTLGGEISASAGPVGMGGVLESEVHKRQTPIWTYMKSRGFYAGAQVDGTIIIERTDENERFYGEKISVHDILRGKARHPPNSIRTLMMTIKAAQGDSDVDESLIAPPGESPSDAIIEPSDSSSAAAAAANHPTFGIPAPDDDDPYGVRALESEGLFIREAGTKVQPDKDVFQFRPSLSSPVYNNFGRLSRDLRRSWRESSQSFFVDSYMDRGTQTDPVAITAITTPPSLPPRRPDPETVAGPDRPPPNTDLNVEPNPNVDGEEGAGPAAELDLVPEPTSHHRSPSIPWDLEEDSRPSSRRDSRGSSLHSPPETPILSNGHAAHVVNDADDDADMEFHEVHDLTISKPEIAEVAIRSSSPVEVGGIPASSKPRLVTIAKRPIPPALPPRNPTRKHDSLSTQSSGMPTSPSPTTSTHPGIHDYTDFIHTYETPELLDGDEEPEFKLDPATWDKIHRISSIVPTDDDATLFAEHEEFHSLSPTPTSEEEHPVLGTHPTERPGITA